MTHTASSQERHGGSSSVRVGAIHILAKQQVNKYHHITKSLAHCSIVFRSTLSGAVGMS